MNSKLQIPVGKIYDLNEREREIIMYFVKKLIAEYNLNEKAKIRMGKPPEWVERMLLEQLDSGIVRICHQDSKFYWFEYYNAEDNEYQPFEV